MTKEEKNIIRKKLVRQLIDENRLWSYDTSKITDLPDELLVEKMGNTVTAICSGCRLR
ncbi:MAG: hypothetical protein MJZ61_06050 [Bacteroidales bacterium]|nr:hypothetical protein [Bacteroidales bacterium]